MISVLLIKVKTGIPLSETPKALRLQNPIVFPFFAALCPLCFALRVEAVEVGDQLLPVASRKRHGLFKQSLPKSQPCSIRHRDQQLLEPHASLRQAVCNCKDLQQASRLSPPSHQVWPGATVSHRAQGSFEICEIQFWRGAET